MEPISSHGRERRVGSRGPWGVTAAAYGRFFGCRGRGENTGKFASSWGREKYWKFELAGPDAAQGDGWIKARGRVRSYLWIPLAMARIRLTGAFPKFHRTV